MPDAELRKQCVNGANLDASLAARIAQGCRTDVVVPIRLQQRQSGKPFDDLGPRPGARKTLQELLENKTCRDDDLRTQERVLELMYLRLGDLNVTTKSQRPNACINQKRHLRRDRSAL